MMKKSSAQENLLAFIPAKKRTEEICMEYMNRNPWNICFLPSGIKRKFIGEEYAKEVVRTDFHLIKYFPGSIQKKLTEWIWENRTSIEYFNIHIFLELSPRKFFNSLRCKEIISSYPQPGIFTYIPKKYLTSKLFEYACRKNPAIIKKIPGKLPSTALQRLVTTAPVFSHLPQELKNGNLFRRSLNSYSQA